MRRLAGQFQLHLLVEAPDGGLVVIPSRHAGDHKHVPAGLVRVADGFDRVLVLPQLLGLVCVTGVVLVEHTVEVEKHCRARALSLDCLTCGGIVLRNSDIEKERLRWPRLEQSLSRQDGEDIPLQ
jgi:hypothetical protein